MIFLSFIINFILWFGNYWWSKNEPVRIKCVVLTKSQECELYPEHFFDGTITHYYKGNLILYNIPLILHSDSAIGGVNWDDTSKITFPTTDQPDTLVYEPDSSISTIKKFDNYYLREKGSSHAVMLQQPEAMLQGYMKEAYEFSSFDDRISYESNMGLVYAIPQINKKRVKSVNPKKDIWIDTYIPIVKDKSHNDLDSIIVTYNQKMVDCPFSFGKILDSVHESKVVSIRIVSHFKAENKEFKIVNLYNIEEVPVENPAKIDSIFTKLIPYLPKK